MAKTRITALLILLLGIGLGVFVYKSEIRHRNLAPKATATGLAKYPFKLGLDLSGGTELVLDANMKGIAAADRSSALDSAQQVIERRINLFGVSEPIIQTAITVPDKISSKNFHRSLHRL